MIKDMHSPKKVLAAVDEKLREARSHGVRVDDNNAKDPIRYLTAALDVVVDFGQSRVAEMPAWKRAEISARVK